MNRSSLTEETPAAPGWVDGRVRDIFAQLGEGAAKVGSEYADCLAGVRGAMDVDAGHDRCRRTAIAAMENHGIDIDKLDRTLQALEAELSGAT